AQIEAYAAAVDQALTDLETDDRAELLEDLPEHLADVLADGDGATLREQLGAPSEYAAELRAAAGYAPAGTDREPRARLAEVIARFRARLEQTDRALGALLAYGRLVDLTRALQPGRWV